MSTFKKNKYKVLRGAISKELASFVYSYFLKKRQVARFLFDQKYISPFTEYWGIWNDNRFLIVILIIQIPQWKHY